MKKSTSRLDLLPVLRRLAGELIAAALEAGVSGLTEGTVLSSGPAPYRRLDCDGRALAYIRPRPRKKAVRVDITGLWRAPRGSKLRLPSAGGAAALLLKSEVEVYEAVRFLVQTVERTRRHEAQAEEKARAKAALLDGEMPDAAPRPAPKARGDTEAA